MAHSEVRHRPIPAPGHPFQDTDLGGRRGVRPGAGLIKRSLRVRSDFLAIPRHF